jgi:hypothetical protein
MVHDSVAGETFAALEEGEATCLQISYGDSRLVERLAPSQKSPNSYISPATSSDGEAEWFKSTVDL